MTAEFTTLPLLAAFAPGGGFSWLDCRVSPRVTPRRPAPIHNSEITENLSQAEDTICMGKLLAKCARDRLFQASKPARHVKRIGKNQRRSSWNGEAADSVACRNQVASQSLISL